MSETGRMLTSMTDLIGRTGRMAGCLAAVALALSFSAPAHAQRTTSKEVVDCYNKAQELLTQEKTREAMAGIRQCLAGERTPDERAVLLRFAAQLEVELGNYPAAIRYIEESFQTPLTDIEKAENYFFLGRLYLGIEPPNYAKAVENLRKFISVAKNPDPDAYFYLGQALAMQGQYREAIPNGQKAIELSKTPKENHYRLLLFCYSELNDYRQVVSLVERMLTLFSVKDEYLSQLAAGYQELGREKEAFLVQAFRYELGFLDSEGELVGMAELYQIHENPHRAARILEKEMKAGRVRKNEKNHEKLGNMWFLAREYNEARNYLKLAAVESRKGELDFRIGQTYFEDEEWKQAETHFRRALTKGVKEPCQARVLLAHTLVNQENPQGAIEEFKRAAQSKLCAREARDWVTYLELQEQVRIYQTSVLVMRKAIAQLQKISAPASDDENVRAISIEAVEAAQAALDAESGQVRASRLSEYERARDSALRRFSAGAMEEARADLEETNKTLAEARAEKLPEQDQNLLNRLEEMSKGRVKALEEAQANLDKAKKIADQARAKSQ